MLFVNIDDFKYVHKYIAIVRGTIYTHSLYHFGIT